ncbi:hypothetical protein [Streptomyces sp. F001]|uniref:hypothetical protein n=1 Tax=Streptomyces sp. F001 TaxID=1510026 RepID=UPI00101E4AF4|nr:hypothetical protein [Streptomyces sp. F001]
MRTPLSQPATQFDSQLRKEFDWFVSVFAQRVRREFDLLHIKREEADIPSSTALIHCVDHHVVRHANSAETRVGATEKQE